MTPTKVLAWKEWQEQRWFMLAGVTLISVVPLIIAAIIVLIQYIFGYPQGYQESLFFRLWHTLRNVGPGFVLSLGGAFAIFLAVGITSRDLHDPLAFFWRSRPIGVGRWLLIKYLTGLEILLISCSAVLFPKVLMNIFVERNLQWELDPVVILFYHTFTLILIYSISFWLGCLVRQAARAAILSLAAGLLVYFLPVIFPPLSFMSVYTLMLQAQPGWYQSGYFSFVAAMLAGSAIAAVLSGISVKRDWRLPPDQRVVFWSLGGVAIILFAASAFQLGSNLTCERQMNLPAILPNHSCYIASIANEGNQGVILIKPIQKSTTYYLRRFDFSKPDPFPDRNIALNFPLGKDGRFRIRKILWSADHPNRAFILLESWLYKSDPQAIIPKAPILCTVDLDGAGKKPIIHSMDLHMKFPMADGFSPPPYEYFLSGQTIYISNHYSLILVDIKDTDRPRISYVYDKIPSFFCQIWSEFERGPVMVNLFPDTRFSLPERLDLALKIRNDPDTVPLGNNLLFLFRRFQKGYAIGIARFSTFEKSFVGFTQPGPYPPSSNIYAMFDMIGMVRPSPLESLWDFINGQNLNDVLVHQGFAYIKENGGLRVYDLRRPDQPRQAGHFAVGKWISAMAPLGEGRILVACPNDLYILAPPK